MERQVFFLENHFFSCFLFISYTIELEIKKKNYNTICLRLLVEWKNFLKRRKI